MDKYDIILDGVSGADMGLLFPSPLELSAPEPRVITESVPGRNGDVHIFDGSYKNRTAYLRGCLYQGFVNEAFDVFNEWLFAKPGYLRLETPAEEGKFLMARVVNGSNVLNRANKVAPVEIKFDCKPQRFLKVGEISRTVYNTDLGTNPFYNITKYSSKPLIKINYTTRTGAGYIYIDNGNDYETVNTVKVDTLKLANYGSSVFYDAEIDVLYNDYRGGTYYDGIISYDRDVILSPGDNHIVLDGDIDSVEITPRWWVL